MNEQDHAESGDTHTPESGDKPQSSARGRLLTVVVVLLLAAAGAGGWWWWQTRPDSAAEDPLAGLESRLDSGLAIQGERSDELAARLDGLDERLGALEGDAARLETAADDGAGERQRLQRRLDELARDLQRLDRRGEAEISALREDLESSGRTLPEVAAETARDLRLMQAASLLRAGQRSAELQRDWRRARRAYERAADILRAVDDPRLTRVRTLLGQELEALNAVDEPDWHSLQAGVLALAGASEDWPAAGSAIAPEDGVAGQDNGDGWWARTRRALGGLVRVRSRDGSQPTEAELDLIREGVRARALMLSLALGREQAEAVREHAEKLAQIIEQWFDDRDRGVARALEITANLRELHRDEIPALGAALAELETQTDS